MSKKFVIYAKKYLVLMMSIQNTVKKIIVTILENIEVLLMIYAT